MQWIICSFSSLQKRVSGQFTSFETAVSSRILINQALNASIFYLHPNYHHKSKYVILRCDRRRLLLFQWVGWKTVNVQRDEMLADAQFIIVFGTGLFINWVQFYHFREFIHLHLLCSLIVLQKYRMLRTLGVCFYFCLITNQELLFI